MEKLRIWIVDDDTTYRNFLVSYLAVIGYTPQEFSSGEECLARLQEHPDVILLDHNLGDGMNGAEALQKIKMYSPKTHVIYISGDAKPSQISDAYKLGSEEYISKDSASLLRMKLALEKIQAEKAERAEMRKQSQRIKIWIGIAAAMAMLLYFVIS